MAKLKELLGTLVSISAFFVWMPVEAVLTFALFVFGLFVVVFRFGWSTSWWSRFKGDGIRGLPGFTAHGPWAF